MWDLDTGGEDVVFRGHGSPIAAVAFNADGTQLAAAYEYLNLVVVWDRTRHPDRGTFVPPGKDLEAVGFVAGGTRLGTVNRQAAFYDEYDAASGASSPAGRGSTSTPRG